MSATTTRLATIDALRGFALLGILMVNQSIFHSGIIGGLPGSGFGPAGWRTATVDTAITWLFTGKFILIFAFLFGWGVLTQATRDGSFRARYLRRLIGLLVLGLLHAAFFFAGDILVTYAVLGLFMLRPVRRDWPVAKLVQSAVVLLALQAAVLVLMAAVIVASGGDDGGFMEEARRSAQIYRTGDFWTVVALRLKDFGVALAITLTLLGFGLVAMFRLGLAAAKTFAQGGVEAVQPVARRVLWPALILGLVGNAVCAVLVAALPEPWTSSTAMLQIAFFAPILSLGYLAAAALIFSAPAGARLVPLLAAPGRMSLSVYIGQSVIMSLLYHGYGLGLAALIGSAGSVLICLAVYAVLVGFSLLWLSAFRVGPLEWILRSFTEWRWVALRARLDPSAGPAPA